MRQKLQINVTISNLSKLFRIKNVKDTPIFVI